jgi:regulator of RNase E activity RraA
VVFVPSDAAEKVIALAERIVTREAAMSEAVNAGESVVDVMHDDRFPRVEAGAQ